MKKLLTAACMFVAIAVAIGSFITQAVFGQAPKSVEAKPLIDEITGAKVDKLFAQWDKPESPGCSVAAIKDGKIVYKRGYGMANLDYNIPITPGTVFHVASMSKQFTAAAVVLLAQEGKLSLDDPARKYIPKLPDFGVPITIRHLIFHTSGLRDQWDLLGLAGWRYSRDLITDDDVLSLISRQKELNFPPGTRFLYSNTGYTLLAQIVKQVSGQSFREFTTSRIFQPLGMKQTHFRDDHAEIVKNVAYGYRPSSAAFRMSNTNFDTVGATSLLTSVEDLALWSQNFYDPRVGGPSMIKQMLERGKLSNGEQLDYAFGLVIGPFRGLATVDHGGSDAGYRSQMIRFPGQRFTAVVLCNSSATNPTDLAQKVAGIYLGQEMKPSITAPGADEMTVQLSEPQLKSKVGLYWNRDEDQTLRITLKDGKLHINGNETNALGENHFRRVNAPVYLKFEASTIGGTLRLVWKQTGVSQPVVILFDAVSDFTPSPLEMKEYVGSYRSQEIEPPYEIKFEQGKLVLHRLKSNGVTLNPLVRDLFDADVGAIRFNRDNDRQIIGFMLTTGRIIKLRFDKTKVRKL